MFSWNSVPYNGSSSLLISLSSEGYHCRISLLSFLLSLSSSLPFLSSLRVELSIGWLLSFSISSVFSRPVPFSHRFFSSLFSLQSQSMTFLFSSCQSVFIPSNPNIFPHSHPFSYRYSISLHSFFCKSVRFHFSLISSSLLSFDVTLRISVFIALITLSFGFHAASIDCKTVFDAGTKWCIWMKVFRMEKNERESPPTPPLNSLGLFEPYVHEGKKITEVARYL